VDQRRRALLILVSGTARGRLRERHQAAMDAAEAAGDVKVLVVSAAVDRFIAAGAGGGTGTGAAAIPRTETAG